MTSTNQHETNLVDILKQFSNEYIHLYQLKHKHLPILEHDEEWPSPCELPLDGTSDEKNIDNSFLSAGEVFWKPALMKTSAQCEPEFTFDNVESALDMALHCDIKTYFTTLFSESLDASCEEGNLALLFAWNDADFQRLQENLIGHILMKRRLKQAETVFFAVTDEEDMIISIDNQSGSVWVERVGCEPHKRLAKSLAEFISILKPQVG